MHRNVQLIEICFLQARNFIFFYLLLYICPMNDKYRYSKDHHVFRIHWFLRQAQLLRQVSASAVG